MTQHNGMMVKLYKYNGMLVKLYKYEQWDADKIIQI